MKSKLFNFLRIYPFFTWLLPIFFVFHGYTEFYDLIPAKDSVLLALKYLIAATLLICVCWLFFRNIFKASILVFLLFAYNFFFGPAHDWIKQQFPGSLFSRYVFILPASLLVFILLTLFLKKRKKTFYLATSYLNLLMLILLIIDAGILINKITQKNSRTLAQNEFIKCIDCSKPDVYYILADEYAGKKQLTEMFKFDNSAFENELKKRGFHIVEDSKSNYNYTIFSAPSILNMNYINVIQGRNQSIPDRKICLDMMQNNTVFQFFKMQGYETYNYSPFFIQGHPYLAKPSFLPRYTGPLVSQTFFSRIEKDLWFHLVTDLRLPGLKENVIYNDKRNNDLFLRLTKKVATRQTEQPKFVYTHLIMPHYPYYFDKGGKKTPYDNLGGEKTPVMDLYLNYLIYSNNIFLNLIDTIRTLARRPYIIIFMSDHGFKSLPNYQHAEYYFTNFNSILLPDSNYAPFYNGISNVNEFRVLLNSRFNQNLPLLKDSTSFMTE
jgi:hypothetical protein